MASKGGDKKGPPQSLIARRRKTRSNSILISKKEWTRGEVATVRERNAEGYNKIIKELNIIKRRVDRVRVHVV